MDVNNTKYHLISGAGDWLPLLVEQDSADLWWDGQSRSVLLAPVVEKLGRLGDDAASEQSRRGAAYDHYGNVYRINEARDAIVFRPQATPRKEGVFWSTKQLNEPIDEKRDHGDFQPVQQPPPMTEPVLRGLIVTRHEFLIVGTLQPAGLLVFDLHGGGPPGWLRWPDDIPFAPYDITAAPDGGFWVLDKDLSGGDARFWHMDRYFRLLPCSGDAVESTVSYPHDFSTAGGDPETTPQLEFLDGNPLNLASPVLVPDPLAIEAIDDNRLLVLGNDDVSVSTVYYFQNDRLVDQVRLDDEVIGALLQQPWISGYDLVFIADDVDQTRRLTGSLYISARDINQAFEFRLTATHTELDLVLLPKLYPMRSHTGKTLIPYGDAVHYLFESRWLPLAEQPRHHYQSRAQLDGIVRDGYEPDCVWHRIVMDACIPAGTAVHIESRAANTPGRLAEQPWTPEPPLYRRADGSELPMHEPFADHSTAGEAAGSWELLLQNAVGRYIEIRLTLTGTRRTTPRIVNLRIHYPRFSYLERYLPAVYRDDPVSADFLDRFLANVEGLFTGLEERVAHAHTLFDTRTTPPEFLEWLAGWLGAGLDPAWDEQRKRLFIDHAELLFRWRGTQAGMLAAIRLVVDECPDERIFDTLKGRGRDTVSLLAGRQIRIAEGFLRRSMVGLENTDGNAPVQLNVESQAGGRWSPEQGVAVLNRRFQQYLTEKYGSENTVEHINAAWDTDYKTLNAVRFPALTPGQQVWRKDRRAFLDQAVHFTYADVTGDDEPVYQEFLLRRYRQIQRLNSAYGLTGGSAYQAFDQIPLPGTLPSIQAALTDWLEFTALAIPIRRDAHRFTVLLPTALGELPASMARRKAQVETIVRREKPAHTDFDVQFFWALFQAGSARVGIDTSVGEGGRFAAMVLGLNFLGQSFLAESHPWSATGRAVVGRDRLATDPVWRI